MCISARPYRYMENNTGHQVPSEQDIADYLDYSKNVRGLSNNTILAYRSDLAIYNLYSADHPESSLNTFASYLRVERGLKNSSIRRCIASIKGYYRHLERSKNIRDPILNEHVPLKVEKRLPKILSNKELESLLRTLKTNIEETSGTAETLNIRNLALIDLLICTGIRCAESTSIRMCDIHHENRSILIHGKGSRERIIFISSEDTWNNLIRWESVRSVISDSDLLFITRNGDRMATHDIEYIFNKLKIQSGINPSATPHFIRHTFATNLLANGADIRSVQELLGHASITTTEIYTEVSVSRKKAVLEKYNQRNLLRFDSIDFII